MHVFFAVSGDLDILKGHKNRHRKSQTRAWNTWTLVRQKGITREMLRPIFLSVKRGVVLS